MPKSEKPPTIKSDHPLQKGSRWIWVPVLCGAFISILGSYLISLAGCR